MLKLLGGFVRGMRASDQSLATGLLIGLMVWTLTHLVDSVASNGTVEYAVGYYNDVLSGQPEQHVYRMDVTVSNLSRDTPISNLEVSIQNPHPDHQATFYPAETACTFDAPSWAGMALCDGHEDGGDLQVPMLVPGTSVGFSMKYSGSIAPQTRPIVRIRPGAMSNFRLVEPGVETYLTRNETRVLLGILLLAALVFVINVSLPRSEPASGKGGSGPP